MKKTTAVLIALPVLAIILFAAVSRSHSGAKKAEAADRKILYYVDPMNPAHTSDKPGLAPCGMKMEPVYADTAVSLGAAATTATRPLAPGAVRISLDKQQLMGVRLGQPQKTAGTRTLRTLGRVALDETRIFRTTVPVDGIVRSASQIVSGSFVRKDDVLATFYNRDFLTAEQTYFYALNTMDRFKENESEDQLKLTRAQVRAAEENLEFLGMTEMQIRQLAKTRELTKEIELRSPVNGLVLGRNAFQGLRFDRGTELFRIGEMEHVWVLADVFENEGQYFEPGTIARITLRTHNKTFPAKVSNALSQFDPVSRTLKVRLEAENEGYLMRPDMFVDVELPVNLPEALVVPAEAVLDSGLRRMVFVDCGEGVFEPRKVETGWRFGDHIQIVSGLMGDERIVISGNFLIDSESRMKMAAAGVSAEMAKDPVCGMSVDSSAARTAKLATEHEGKTFYFCNLMCKQRFDKEPSKFISKIENAPDVPAPPAVLPSAPGTNSPPKMKMESSEMEQPASTVPRPVRTSLRKIPQGIKNPPVEAAHE